MRLFLLAFVVGCWLLQQQPALPGARAAFVLAAAALVLALLSAACLYRGRRAPLAARGMACLLGLLAGFGWAAWRAEQRLADWLPAALEGRTSPCAAWWPACRRRPSRGCAFCSPSSMAMLACRCRSTCC